jgi:hypothetical protein
VTVSTRGQECVASLSQPAIGERLRFHGRHVIVAVPPTLWRRLNIAVEGPSSGVDHGGCLCWAGGAPARLAAADLPPPRMLKLAQHMHMPAAINCVLLYDHEWWALGRVPHAAAGRSKVGAGARAGGSCENEAEVIAACAPDQDRVSGSSCSQTPARPPPADRSKHGVVGSGRKGQSSVSSSWGGAAHLSCAPNELQRPDHSSLAARRLDELGPICNLFPAR